jgi:hypothetical protein
MPNLTPAFRTVAVACVVALVAACVAPPPEQHSETESERLERVGAETLRGVDTSGLENLK